MKVALVTAENSLDLDEDMPRLAAALAKLGVEARPVAWNDPAAQWDKFDMAVIRSTWDYVPKRDEFVRWAERAAVLTKLFNPALVIRWNTDKIYLRYLAAVGIPIVPTAWLDPSDAAGVPFDGEVVVKPKISAGAMDVARHKDHEAAIAHIKQLQNVGRAVMVQPYLKTVDESGETALIYFNGRYSHSIRKAPILKMGIEYVKNVFAKELISPCEPSRAERQLADRVLEAIPGGHEQLLYIRVDVAAGTDSKPCLMELEITEPSLFLGFSKGAAERFAQAIIEKFKP